VIYEYQQQLWKAINGYTESCNGDTSNETISTNRMDKVIRIEYIISKIRAFNNKAESIKCSICGNLCNTKAAHLHQGEYIGDECCWDERLRSSE
jgi:hypothetical protein